MYRVLTAPGWAFLERWAPRMLVGLLTCVAGGYVLGLRRGR